MTKFKDAVECLKKHSETTYHKHAVEDLRAYQMRMDNPHIGVDMMIDNTSAERVKSNQQILASKIKTIFKKSYAVANPLHFEDIASMKMAVIQWKFSSPS